MYFHNTLYRNIPIILKTREANFVKICQILSASRQFTIVKIYNAHVCFSKWSARDINNIL